MKEFTNPDHDDMATCLSALDEILDLRRETADKAELERRLADFLTPHFDVGVLEPDVKVGDVKARVIVGDVLLIWFGTAENDYPFRATFSRIEQGQWRIVAFEFGCPACFGETILDGNVCPLCCEKAMTTTRIRGLRMRSCDRCDTRPGPTGPLRASAI